MTNVSERWLPVVGYEGTYEVSSLGNVRKIISKDVFRNLNDFAARHYRAVALPKGNGWGNLLTHRLVAQAFIANPDKKPHVNHKDSNPHNNNIDNLEWVTQFENNAHARAAALKKECPSKYIPTRTASPVVQISKEGDYITEYKSCTNAERTTGISTIWDACSGYSDFAGGYIWMWKHKYEEYNNHKNLNFNVGLQKRKHATCYIIFNSNGNIVYISMFKFKPKAIEDYLRAFKKKKFPKGSVAVESVITPKHLTT